MLRVIRYILYDITKDLHLALWNKMGNILSKYGPNDTTIINITYVPTEPYQIILIYELNHFTITKARHHKSQDHI